MLAALGLFEDAVDLPVDGTIPQDRAWKTSQITPMGGRITFERLTCKPHHTPAETYIRLNVNDGIVPLKGCSSGPGESCQLGEFFKYVKRRGKEAGVFAEVCGLGEDAAKGLSFLRQPAFPVKR